VPEGGTGTEPTSSAMMAERYGSSRRRSRASLIFIVGLLAVASLTWLGWVAWHHATPDVRGGLRSYEIVSDHEVSVVIDVKRSTSASVECTVRAQAESHGIVADQQVTIPAGSQGDVRFTAVVPTERRATAVTVTDCH
jgi:hypothetical protein